MPNVTKPYGDFVNNVDVADASKVNGQFNTLYNAVNGGLDYTNIPALGSPSTLQTTAQDTFVNAINEVNTKGTIDFLFRQALINGSFEVWQRGTSFTNPNTGQYTADRWKLAFDGSGQLATVTRQAFTIGQTAVPNEPKYFFQYQVTTAVPAQTINNIQQLIESVRTFAGQKCTLSFWAKADTARSVYAILRQNFGTGGSPSSVVDTSSTSFALTTSWQKFTYTFNLPSISGKTLGTNNDDSLGLIFVLPPATNFTISLSQVGINFGDQPLPFQPRSFAEELALCQRYYEKSYDVGTAPGAVTPAGALIMPVPSNTVPIGQFYGSVRYSVPKRTAPTVTIYGAGGSSGQVSDQNGSDRGANTGANVGTLNGVKGFVPYNNSGATFATGLNVVQFQYTSDAEL